MKYFINVRLKGYPNKYLQEFLTSLHQENFSIVGDEDVLEACPCCCYLTLPNRGNYDICPLCEWEDDGKSCDELDIYSSANHSTLSEYRKKFAAQKLELNKIPYNLASSIAD